jgi:hypothetical protein
MRATDCCQLWCNPVAIRKKGDFSGGMRHLRVERGGKNCVAAGIFTKARGGDTLPTGR